MHCESALLIYERLFSAGGKNGFRTKKKEKKEEEAVDGQNFQQTASAELRQVEQIVFLTPTTTPICSGTTCPFLVAVVPLSVEHSTQSFTHPSSSFSWVRRVHLLAVVVPPWVVHSTQSGQNVDFIRSQYAIRRGNSSAKMEPSSLQTINKGKRKPAVYSLSTRENGN